MSQGFSLRSRPDMVKLGGIGGGGPKILANAWSGGIRIKLGAKNNHKS